MAEQAQGVEKPVLTWRQKVIQAGAIVAKPYRRYRAAVFQGYLVAAILLFLILAVLAHTVAYFTFDVIITRDIQTISVVGFAGLMQFLSWMGFSPQVTLISLVFILFLYLTGLKWEAVVNVLSIIGITIVGFVIKVLVDRPRPEANLGHVVSQLSD